MYQIGFNVFRLTIQYGCHEKECNMNKTWDQPSKNPIFVLLCSHGHQNLMAILTHFLWNGIGQEQYVCLCFYSCSATS